MATHGAAAAPLGLEAELQQARESLELEAAARRTAEERAAAAAEEAAAAVSE